MPRMTNGIRPGPPTPDPFDRIQETTINGRRVYPNTELTVPRIKGRVRFVEVVTHKATGNTSIAVIDKKGHARSVTADEVTTVHRIAKTRSNQ